MGKKKAIVIGATSGIGKELAELLAENNYLVGITGRRTELLENLKNENQTLFIGDLLISPTSKQRSKISNHCLRSLMDLIYWL